MLYKIFARVPGPGLNCHIIHASQTPWPDEWSSSVEGNPQPYLLATVDSSPCVGCHSSDNHSTNSYPVVSFPITN